MIRFTQDDFAREIESISRMISQILFHKRLTCGPDFDQTPQAQESGELLEELMNLTASGSVNEAENKLFATFEDHPDEYHLEIAMLFYNHLNDQDDDWLEEADFTREEILEGLKSIYQNYLLSSTLK